MFHSSDTSRQRPLRLLLVEDHRPLADATARFIRGAGLASVDVRIAESGEAALSTAMAFRPDIVLCDFRLPDMSGLDVARQLRTNPATKHARFAVQTALAPADVRGLKWRADGVDFFFFKPLTESNLDELLAGLATPDSPSSQGDAV